jgi:hypothetical protein
VVSAGQHGFNVVLLANFEDSVAVTSYHGADFNPILSAKYAISRCICCLSSYIICSEFACVGKHLLRYPNDQWQPSHVRQRLIRQPCGG